MNKVKYFSRLIRNKQDRLVGVMVAEPKIIDGEPVLLSGWSLTNLKFDNFDLVRGVEVAKERMLINNVIPHSLNAKYNKFREKAARYFSCKEGVIVDNRLVKGGSFRGWKV